MTDALIKYDTAKLKIDICDHSKHKMYDALGKFSVYIYQLFSDKMKSYSVEYAEIVEFRDYKACKVTLCEGDTVQNLKKWVADNFGSGNAQVSRIRTKEEIDDYFKENGDVDWYKDARREDIRDTTEWLRVQTSNTVRTGEGNWILEPRFESPELIEIADGLKVALMISFRRLEGTHRPEYPELFKDPVWIQMQLRPWHNIAYEFFDFEEFLQFIYRQGYESAVKTYQDFMDHWMEGFKEYYKRLEHVNDIAKDEMILKHYSDLCPLFTKVLEEEHDAVYEDLRPSFDKLSKKVAQGVRNELEGRDYNDNG